MVWGSRHPHPFLEEFLLLFPQAVTVVVPCPEGRNVMKVQILLILLPGQARAIFPHPLKLDVAVNLLYEL